MLRNSYQSSQDLGFIRRERPTTLINTRCDLCMAQRFNLNEPLVTHTAATSQLHDQAHIREGRFEPGICTRNGMTQWHPTQTNTLNGVWQVIPIETYRPSNLYLSLRDIYHRSYAKSTEDKKCHT
ncbi:hypothetical protein SCLCIDRAFT_871760 [Scleroderma citrinum Foug A]|uniref:Uncharacterized protein n=1 Tax=Scleroderma citrinum Foug A TaxID=1036808 RepID=A0A0C3DLA4_9AGAM|nr:hypothetical protein SCLCIDRAFT_871760 [Scleroderma citrinum Foug A]